MQRMPSYYKNQCTTPFFCMNSPRNRGWYPARVHPFSSGNGKGDLKARSSLCMLRIHFWYLCNLHCQSSHLPKYVTHWQ